jgi:hypothetical protein
MRVFFGMILGVCLTFGVAFVHDTWNGGPTSTTTGSDSTLAQRQMVNWDVVGENWRVVKQRARETWSTLSHKVSS